MLIQNIYPFTAIVGQEQIKKALIIAITNPQTGGLLISGQKGTAKTTMVRSCRELAAVQKIIDLPLNITEDMLFGSLDIEYAVNKGHRRFSAGLLDKADNNIIYIDEVNLLRQELLTAVFNTNTLGINHVERDRISHTHETHFTVIAAMNPEEGVLPGYLLDRFGMYVNAQSETNIQKRVKIIKRVLSFEKGSQIFRKEYAAATAALAAKIIKARSLLTDINIDDAMIQLAAQMSAKAFCAGHRAEFYLLETARTIAALNDRNYILPKDMEEASVFVLVHRMRKPPEQENQQDQPKQRTDNQDSTNESTDTTEQQNEGNNSSDGNTSSDSNNGTEEKDTASNDDQQPQYDKNSQAPDNKTSDIDKAFTIPPMEFEKRKDRIIRRGTGKRSITKTDLMQGRYVRAELPKDKVSDIALDATIRAAAPYQRLRTENGCALNIQPEDIRQKVREKRIGRTFLFVVDASGSMGAYERMSAVKGAIFYMLQEAYQKRDRVGMIAFRRHEAEMLLPITRSVDLAEKCLQQLPTGGKTPLANGLSKALQVLSLQNKKDSDMQAVLILITDGRANAVQQDNSDPIEDALQTAKQIQKSKIASVVIDTETDFIRLDIAKDVAAAMGAAYYNLESLKKETVIRIVHNLDR